MAKKIRECILNVSTNDIQNLLNTMGFESFEAGTETLNDDGLRLSIVQKKQLKDFPPLGVLEILVSFPVSVASGIVGSWLYDKLRGNCSNLKINGVETENSRNGLDKAMADVTEDNE